MLLLALSFSRSLYENIFVELLLPFFSLVLCGKPMNDVVYFRYYFDKLNLPQTTVLQIEQDKRGFYGWQLGMVFTGSMVVRQCLCTR